ncbi:MULTISPECIES: DUF2278 family protein [unclassified Streptomyces]|uniref:DUF2278 family protein n=1 Tax=unclassified Streptomyces TaxID=2593676 RepID=UPI001BEA3E47|nr:MULTISPECIES: DUF2278 family protein [unclassified Streptomyces]MBT2406568.1 DUF2278 family protein [Streptomyces sp. ISL-21]MBT2458036.1 DUF2278 family protein [Streptomyces sp. ISL-86]MBT2608906.1 DUF2278 family protein [Streptomyces sp. ISL-87]
MPLDDYGVLAGTLHRHFRGRPDTQGRWFHVNLEVDAPAGRYRCAIDVDSEQSGTGVQWKVLTLAASVLDPASALPPGYHNLARTPGSGALDHLRHPALNGRRGWGLTWLEAALDRLNPPRPWISGSCREASAALEAVLVPGRPVLVFGQPFDHGGLGMRNIHQNQGDPHGSRWWDANGSWQDGATMTRRDDGWYDAFLSRFSTQETGGEGGRGRNR